MNENAPHGSDGDARPVLFEDRLLAEAVRLGERDADVPPEARANAERIAALTESAGFEERIAIRARHLPGADAMASALAHVRRSCVAVVVAGAIVALLAGAATVRAALGTTRNEPINVYWVLGSVLGVQTIVLVAWAAILVARPRGPVAASFGTIVVAMGRWLASRLRRGPDHGAAISAWTAALSRGGYARWILGSISHALWLTFNLGAIAMLVALLSTRHYTFGWETTILDARAYVPITRALEAIPRGLGLDVPDDAEIAASEWTGAAPIPEGLAAKWSTLIVWSVVLYGFAPRLLLLIATTLAAARARRRLRLDVDMPAYARLRPRLDPLASSLGVVDPDRGGRAAPAVGASAVFDARPPGAPAIVGLEIERPAGGWPPRLDGVRWDDLGVVENREDRMRVTERLERASTGPAPLVAVADLTTTPDRGIISVLGALSAAAGAPALLVLTGGQRLRDRAGGDAASRFEDWSRAAGEAGVERVREIDLDHLTQSSRDLFASLVAGASREGTTSGRLGRAFEVIREHAAGRQGDPTTADQAALQKAIAEVYGHDRASWRRLLRAPETLGADLAAGVAPAARRVVELLPARLRASRRWITAGAIAGGVGALAAVTFVAPAAIGTLPLWSALGGVIGGLVAPDRTGDRGAGGDAWSPDRADAIRAAALFALLLELQGLPEAAITRVLDAALADDSAAGPGSATDLAAWLDDLRHRADVAVARETRR